MPASCKAFLTGSEYFRVIPETMAEQDAKERKWQSQRLNNVIFFIGFTENFVSIYIYIQKQKQNTSFFLVFFFYFMVHRCIQISLTCAEM